MQTTPFGELLLRDAQSYSVTTHGSTECQQFLPRHGGNGTEWMTMLLQTMSNSDDIPGPPRIGSNEPSSDHSAWTSQEPTVGQPGRAASKKRKSWIESWWAYQLLTALGILLFIYLPKWSSLNPQLRAFVTEYWWIGAALILSLAVYRLAPWRLTGWRPDTFQRVTVALLVGVGVMQLIVANAPPAQRSLGEQFVVSELAISITAAELSLIEKGPPPWDASASSDVRTPAERAVGDFSYGLGRGVGQAITGTGREGKNYDAWLAVYMSFSVPPEGRPRTPDVEVSVRDERGHAYGAAERPYKSFGFGPMRPGQTYRERVLFNVFSDSSQFVVRIASNEIVVAPRR